MSQEPAPGPAPILDALAAGDAETAARLSREHAQLWAALDVAILINDYQCERLGNLVIT